MKAGGSFRNGRQVRQAHCKMELSLLAALVCFGAPLLALCGPEQQTNRRPGEGVAPPRVEYALVLQANRTSAVPDERVMFTADLYPPFRGAEFEFEFGDGNKSGPLAIPQATYRYFADGNYEVRATANLNGLRVQSNTLRLSVHTVRVSVELVPKLDHTKTGEPIEFRAKVTPPVQDAEYTFDFGDGTLALNSRSPDARHSYRQSKTYSAWVAVRTAHEHKFFSPPVQVYIEPSTPLWAIIATVLAVMGVGAYSGIGLRRRWRRGALGRAGVKIRARQGPGKQELEVPEHAASRDEVQFRAVRSAGQQTIEYRGRLVSRIETIHEGN